MRRRALLLLPLLGSLACQERIPEPPPQPDWKRVEAWLASESREDQAQGLSRLLAADRERPGTLGKLAEMPADGNPGLRHYTSAHLMVTLYGDAPSAERGKGWIPGKPTLELLLAGLDDERELAVGAAADWGLPVGRFCLSALELLTGEDPPPRPLNRLPSRAVTARWHRWWHENQDYLFLDPDRGVWSVDVSAKRLKIPLPAP